MFCYKLLGNTRLQILKMWKVVVNSYLFLHLSPKIKTKMKTLNCQLIDRLEGRFPFRMYGRCVCFHPKI